MTTLSTLNIRLNETLKTSESRNLTPTQRERALNDALLFDVKNYRPWPEKVKNGYVQFVDGVANIPLNLSKVNALWYGTDERGDTYDVVDQTRFLSQVSNTATFTDLDGVQVLKISPDDDQGVDQSNETGTSSIGVKNATGNAYLYQTFTAEGATKGAMLRLKNVLAPTGTLTLGLYATSSSLPTGSALVTKTMDIAELTTSYENHFFYLPYTTVASTEYALVLSADYTLSTTDYVAWAYSATSQIADGTRGVYDSVGAAYATATGDMWFITYSEIFSFQYSEKIEEMTSSTDTTGLDSMFDEAIVMLAAARLLERKAGTDQNRLTIVQNLRYGMGGNHARPTPDSAYGKLNTIWDELRVRTHNPRRRMTNIYESGLHVGPHTDMSYLERL